nr:hypothetical protein [uncultured Carboxylicivirga sp.]
MSNSNQIDVLELTNPKHFIPKEGATHKITIHRIKNNPIVTHSLYNCSKLKTKKLGRISSNYEIITTYLSTPEVHFYVGIFDNEIIGTLDFIISSDNQIEIKNFGIGNNKKHQELADQWLSKSIDFCLQFNPKRIFIVPPKKKGIKKLFESCGFSFKKQGHAKHHTTHNMPSGIISNYLINYN